mmetsp:Transcript_9064/g.21211  ORF Transcript_9064/g.21211 Transcript_9064/m.21211 type:complete len:431 (+) Transcript_9064:16-1308(+)
MLGRLLTLLAFVGASIARPSFPSFSQFDHSDSFAPPVPAAAGAFALSVVDFGAKGDGVTDDTEAFIKALEAAQNATGGLVLIPVGQFLITQPLAVPADTTLEGVYRAPPRSAKSGSCILTTWGKSNETAAPFITLATNAALVGLQIFHPDQDPKMPIPYPWTVRALGDDASLVNVLITNPWKGVDFGTVTGGRHFINGLYSQPLKVGLYIDNTFDIGRVEKVHFWPFWSIDASPFTIANCTAFIIGRTDWEYMDSCFAINVAVGFHFIAGPNGPGNVVLTNSGADEPGLSVLVDATESHAGISFTNGQFMGGVKISPTNAGPIKFTSCGFWGVANSTDTHMVVAGGHVMMTACHFIGWAQRNASAPAVQVSAGAIATVNGCAFMDADHVQVVVDGDAAGAVLQGNTCTGGVRIKNGLPASKSVEVANIAV